MKTLTLHEFKEIIAKHHLGNEEFSDFHEYDLNDREEPHTLVGFKFDNVRIVRTEESLDTDLDYDLPVTIINSQMEGIFHIKSGTFKSLKISNCTIQHTLQISGGVFERFDFYGKLESINTDIFIQGGLFKKEVQFTGRLRYLNIENNPVFKKGLRLYGTHVDGVSISGGTFDGDIEFGVFTCEKNVEIISHPSIQSYFMGNELLDGIDAEPVIFNNNNLIFHQNITIGGVCYLSAIECNTIKFLTFGVQEFISINHLHIDKFQGDINISNAGAIAIFLNKFRISDCTISKNATYSLKGFYFNEWIIERVLNIGALLVINAIATKLVNGFTYQLNDDQAIPNDQDGTLKISESDLGKANFVACRFKDELFFSTSKINEVTLTGTSVPDQIKGESALDRRLGYVQFKKILETAGDNIEALRYHSLDMEELTRQLKWDWNFCNWNGVNIEIITLWLNKMSNNHGKSQGRALIAIVVVSIIFFGWYCYSAGFTFQPDTNGWKNFKIIIPYIVEFINPVHKFDFMQDLSEDYPILNFKGGARFVDGLSRFFIGYVIYQFIHAFRKHGKGL